MRIGLIAMATVFVMNCDSTAPVTVRSGPIISEYAGPSAIEFVGQARKGRPGSGAGLLATLNRARNSPEFISDLCNVALQAAATSPQSALIPLSFLGEAKTPAAISCLTSIMERPWPTKGTCTGDDPQRPCTRIAEQEGLAILQAKALDGLGFYRTPATDELILQTISDHPDRGIRAHAVLVYMWNHQNSPTARARVMKIIRPGEERSADRVIKKRGESAADFDRKLRAAFGITAPNRRVSL